MNIGVPALDRPGGRRIGRLGDDERRGAVLRHNCAIGLADYGGMVNYDRPRVSVAPAWLAGPLESANVSLEIGGIGRTVSAPDVRPDMPGGAGSVVSPLQGNAV